MTSLPLLILLEGFFLLQVNGETTYSPLVLGGVIPSVLEALFASRNSDGDIQEDGNDNTDTQLDGSNFGGTLDSGGPQKAQDVVGAALNARNVAQIADVADSGNIETVKGVVSAGNLTDVVNVADSGNGLLENVLENSTVARIKVLNKRRIILPTDSTSESDQTTDKKQQPLIPDLLALKPPPPMPAAQPIAAKAIEQKAKPPPITAGQLTKLTKSQPDKLTKAPPNPAAAAGKSKPPIQTGKPMGAKIIGQATKSGPITGKKLQAPTIKNKKVPPSPMKSPPKGPAVKPIRTGQDALQAQKSNPGPSFLHLPKIASAAAGKPNPKKPNPKGPGAVPPSKNQKVVRKSSDGPPSRKKLVQHSHGPGSAAAGPPQRVPAPRS